MAYNRMSKEEKANGLKELFGLDDNELDATGEDQSLEFSDSNNIEPQESFYETDDDTPAKVETTESADDMPPWMKVLSQRVEETAQEARAARQEAQQMRQESFQQRQQFEQQRQQPAKQEPEEAFWADSSYVNEVAQKIERARQQDMRTVHQVALTQEWQNVNGMYDAYAAELANDPDMPKLDEVIPRQHIKTMFAEFAKNPQAFNGYGQNWKAILTGAYQQASHPHMMKRVKDARAQQDQLAKKREAKKVENNKNLTKVARSGSAVQEPKETYKRARREYRHSSVRGAALNYLNSGD